MLPLEDPTTAGSMMAALMLLGALDNHGLPEALLQQATLGLRDRWRQSEPDLSSNPWSIKWLPWLPTPVSQPINQGACSIAAASTLGLVTGRTCLPRAPGRVKLCSAPCVVGWVLFAVDEADHIRVASSLVATFAKASRMRLLELAELAAMSAERCAYMRAFLLRQVMCMQQQCAHTRHVHATAAHLAFACTAGGSAGAIQPMDTTGMRAMAAGWATRC